MVGWSVTRAVEWHQVVAGCRRSGGVHSIEEKVKMGVNHYTPGDRWLRQSGHTLCVSCGAGPARAVEVLAVAAGRTAGTAPKVNVDNGK